MTNTLKTNDITSLLYDAMARENAESWNNELRSYNKYQAERSANAKNDNMLLSAVLGNDYKRGRTLAANSTDPFEAKDNMQNYDKAYRKGVDDTIATMMAGNKPEKMPVKKADDSKSKILSLLLGLQTKDNKKLEHNQASIAFNNIYKDKYGDDPWFAEPEFVKKAVDIIASILPDVDAATLEAIARPAIKAGRWGNDIDYDVLNATAAQLGFAGDRQLGDYVKAIIEADENPDPAASQALKQGEPILMPDTTKGTSYIRRADVNARREQ